jgi:hypothetical protein
MSIANTTPRLSQRSLFKCLTQEILALFFTASKGIADIDLFASMHALE